MTAGGGQRQWDGGRPVSARGRYYVECPAGAVTELTEGDAGAIGDEIDWLWLYPTIATPGAVSLLDGANIIIPAWPGGIVLNDIRPIFVPLNLRSREGAWFINTPATFTVVAAGAFQ